MSEQEGYVGIDVSKACLDVAMDEGFFSVSNDAAGIAKLIKRLEALDLKGIGIEPSGGYELKAVRALKSAGLPVRMVDSWKLRQFAKGRGCRAKTDRIDAIMIRLFVADRQLPAPLPEQPGVAELRQMLRAREQLLQAKTTLTLQREHLEDRDIARGHQAIIAALTKQIAMLLKRLRAVVGAHHHLKRQVAILSSAPGVGFLVAVGLAADLPELGQLGPKQIASLAGLAPHPQHSGTKRPNGHVSGGRARSRTLLFMAVLTQLRRCAWAKDALNRFTQRGKAKMIGVVALMRKLVLALNAMIKEGREWRLPA
jgi:transposase